jgi:hypothetical protein
VTLNNCILYGDSTLGTSPELYNGVASVNYSDVEGGNVQGTGDISANPLFVGTSNYQLQASSPCASSGSVAAIEATGVTTDLAGNPRIIDGSVGMGAYEYQPWLWTGGPTGNWNTPSNWSGRQAPGASADVVIPTGDVVTLSTGTSFVQGLTLQGTAKLDLTTGTLMIDYGTSSDPISSIYAYLAGGYNGGAWNGAGIISSTVASENASQSNLVYSVGYADGAD